MTTTIAQVSADNPIDSLESELKSTGSPRRRIPLLMQLARALTLSDPHQAIRCAAEAHALAESIGNRAVLADTLLAEGHCLRQLDWKTALQCYFAALDIWEQQGNRGGQVTVLATIAITLSMKGQPERAIPYIQQALDLTAEDEEARLANDLWGIRAIVYSSLDHDQMLASEEQKLALLRHHDDAKAVARSLCGVAAIYVSSRNEEVAASDALPRAELYAVESLRLARQNGLDIIAWEALYLLGQVYAFTGKPADASACFEQIVSQSEAWLQMHQIPDGAPRKVAILNIQSCGKLAGLLASGNEERAAMLYLRRAEQMIALVVEPQMTMGLLSMLAEAASLLDHGTAIRYLEKAIDIGSTGEQSLATQICQVHTELARIHSLDGNFERAFIHQGRRIELKEKLLVEKADREMLALQVQYEVATLRKDSEAQRRTEISLQIELEQHRSQLASQAMQLARQTEMLGKFRNELRVILREASKAETAVIAIKEKLKELPCESIDWTKFEAEFQQSYPDFRTKLVAAYPELTKMEVKVCSMLKLKLTTSDIATLFCLSERSIESHRYNIRKKLSVGKGETVQDLLDRV